jgi:hypothetical protein
VIFADPEGSITVMACDHAPAARPTTTLHGLRRSEE